MRAHSTALAFGATLAAGCVIAGCSGNNGATPLGLPSLAELSAGAQESPVTALMPHQGRIVGTPTELYTRIARGALTCWFGAAGPLKAQYIYHADADPPSKGGRSEIVLFAKDVTAEDPRALRVYRLLISTAEEKTKLEVENIKIPEPLASRISSDLTRWAAGEEGCGEGAVTAGWAAQDAPAAAAKKSGHPPARK